MTPKEWMVDIADAAADLGLGIRKLEPNRIEVYQGNDISITVESVFLSGRLLRSVLRPRPDPASAAETEAA